MTVVAVYTNGSVSWIGSDTAAVYGSGRIMEAGQKWYGANGWMFGHCGDCRVADAIMSGVDALFENMAGPNQFPERLAGLYRKIGMQPRFDHGETVPAWCNSGILARAGAAWDVDGTLSLVPIPAKQVFARGIGGEIAMAAALGYQRAKPEASPEILIEQAIRCAAVLNRQVSGFWSHRIF